MSSQEVYTVLAVGTSHTATAGRKGSRWRRARAVCLAAGEANGTLCYGCQRPIQYHWTGNPRHPMAPTVHHITELWMGGDPLDPTNHVPCHYGCNSRLSGQLRRALRHAGRCGVHVELSPLMAALTDPVTSRQW
jgi:hypothetical protein